MIPHPTLPIVITAHEDRHIRFFDIDTGKFNIFITRILGHYSLFNGWLLVNWGGTLKNLVIYYSYRLITLKL